MTLQDVLQKFFGEVVYPLPCPFCGCKEISFETRKYHNYGEPYHSARVFCTTKGCGAALHLMVTEKHWAIREKIVDEIGMKHLALAWDLTLWNDVYSKWNRRV